MERLLKRLFPRDKAPIPAFILVFAAAFAMNAGVLYNEFLLDDNGVILNNKYITDFRYLPEIFSSSLLIGEEDVASNYYRPLYFFIYTVVYHLFGLNAWGYHLVNLLVLSLNASLVMLLALVFFKKTDGCVAVEVEHGCMGNQANALFAALLFAVMPVHVEVAACATAIGETAFTLFAVLALFFFMRERPFVAAVAYFLSLSSKEPAIMLLPVFVAYDAFVARPRLDRALIARYAPLFFVSAAYLIMRFFALGRVELAVDEDISLFQTIVAAPPLLMFYVKNALLSLDVRYFRAFNPFFSVFDPVVIASSLAIILAVAAALWRCLKGKPLGLLLILLVVLPLLPALYLPAFIFTTAAYADRYFYFSSIGLVILFVVCCDGIFSRFFKRHSLTALTIFMAAVFLWYSWLTIGGVRSWRNIESLFKHAYERAEDDYFMQYTIGGEYQYYGGLDKAIEHLNRSVELNLAGRRADPRNLKRAYTALSKALIDKGDTRGAVAVIDKTLAIDPTDPEANYNMGLIYYEWGMYAEAVASFEKALKRARFYSDKADAYNNIGNIFTETGRYDEAITAYDAGLKVKPGDQRLAVNRRVAIGRKGLSAPRREVAPSP